MPSSVEMCAVCAWRATCNKKYSMSGRDVHCPDFSEDITINRSKAKAVDEGSETGD